MIEDYLLLAYLNAWEYCPRRFYLDYLIVRNIDLSSLSHSMNAHLMLKSNSLSTKHPF